MNATADRVAADLREQPAGFSCRAGPDDAHRLAQAPAEIAGCEDERAFRREREHRRTVAPVCYVLDSSATGAPATRGCADASKAIPRSSVVDAHTRDIRLARTARPTPSRPRCDHVTRLEIDCCDLCVCPSRSPAPNALPATTPATEPSIDVLTGERTLGTMFCGVPPPAGTLPEPARLRADENQVVVLRPHAAEIVLDGAPPSASARVSSEYFRSSGRAAGRPEAPAECRQQTRPTGHPAKRTGPPLSRCSAPASRASSDSGRTYSSLRSARSPGKECERPPVFRERQRRWADAIEIAPLGQRDCCAHRSGGGRGRSSTPQQEAENCAGREAGNGQAAPDAHATRRFRRERHVDPVRGLFKLEACITDRLQPVMRILVEASLQQPDDRDGVYRGRRDQSGSRSITRARISGDVSAVNGPVPVSSSYQHDAKGPDVGAAIDHPSLHLFRRHVAGGAKKRAGPGVDVGNRRRMSRWPPRRPAGRSAFARPKSSTFTAPSGRTMMLAGLRSRWMMPLLVGGFERLDDLLRDGQRIFERHRTARESLGEVLPFDELHRRAHVAYRPSV